MYTKLIHLIENRFRYGHGSNHVFVVATNVLHDLRKKSRLHHDVMKRRLFLEKLEDKHGIFWGVRWTIVIERAVRLTVEKLFDVCV